MAERRKRAPRGAGKRASSPSIDEQSAAIGEGAKEALSPETGVETSEAAEGGKKGTRRSSRGPRAVSRKKAAATPVSTEGSADVPDVKSGGPQIPIIGIGASAGGLEAFEHFFTNMPSDSGMAFVLVQHLDPTHKSILGDLVRRYTRMKVFQVEDGMTVEPNCAYIIPPNRDLAILHGALHLIEPSAPRGLRLPIDFFFRSLAQDQGEHAICIVLSGTGTDGTLGLKAVKGEGGLAIAQEPNTSKYDGMPRSAINTGMVDYVLPSEKIPEQLISYVKHEFRQGGGKVAATITPKPGEYLQKIFILLRDKTGHDFSFYKENTIIRRIERRMSVNQIQQISHYIRYVQQNPLEAGTLFKELLIGVTNFFRDSEAFSALKKHVIPQLFVDRHKEQPLRIWVPGCSTGEEAYSIAMLIRSHMDTMKWALPVQVFATDIDPNAIEVARAGIYPDGIAVDVPPEYLKRFFTKEENTYQVNKTIRDMLVFAVQSVIKDPPFSKLDLVSCRNLLIYMGPELQKRILPLFSYSLNKGGFLFLGTSESLGESADYFNVVDKKWKIFRSKGEIMGGRPLMDFPSPMTPIDPTQSGDKKINLPEKRLTYRELAERLLLQEFAPGCIIVNENGDMLYIHGRMGKYLEPTTGEANLNILNLAREGLRIELTTAIRKVLAQKQTVRYEKLRVKTNGSFQLVDLVIRPITDPPSLRGLMAVVIVDLPTLAEEGVADGKGASGDHQERIRELEQDLKSKKEYLQSTIEELETANEELKSSNEELQSSNEELQSTNEELETSKEELQSVNEELTTVNSEHQNKIEELTQANNDINNLMSATEIGTLFLDMNLCIMRFTQAVSQFINLIQTDVGRPLSHIVSNLKGTDIVKDVKDVLDNLVAKEMELQSQEGRWLLTRIMPYRTVENIIQGVVVTFVDITVLKQTEAELRESRKQVTAAMEKYRTISESGLHGILIHVDGKPVFSNHHFTKVFGFDHPDDILALESVDPLLPPQERKKGYKKSMLFGSGHAPKTVMAIGHRKDGTTVRIAVSSRVVDWDGQIAVQTAVVDLEATQET